MTGHTIHRTAAPVLVPLARRFYDRLVKLHCRMDRIAAEAGFIALVLAAGFALDRLAGIVLTVLENFAK